MIRSIPRDTRFSTFAPTVQYFAVLRCRHHHNNIKQSITMSFFQQSKDIKKKKKNENPLKNVKNPFAQVGKAMGGNNRKFAGEGNSLGGQRAGKLLHFEIPNKGPVGVKIEKRPSKGAIVSLVVEGSQAAKAGIQRGDALYYAGTNGEEEICYEQFLQLASSEERPLVFDAWRVESSQSNTNASSADAYARKQAMIAAAEAREKAHKQKMKPIPKGKETTKPKPVVSNTHEQGPMSEESRKAAEQAKADEGLHAAQLGYNPYETARATAGQARNATVAMTHGTMDGKKDKETTAAPNKPSAPPSLPEAVSPEFEDAYTLLVTTNDEDVVKSSLGIMCKLIINATTKGQGSTENAAKFRRVRLSNEKIKAAIPDVNGALDVMFAVGFQIMEEDGESYLVYPPGESGPDWLPESLEQMQQFAKT